MRYFLFGVLPAACLLFLAFAPRGTVAQEPTPEPTPVTVTLSAEQIAADVIVIPFPDHATTITFALTDPDAPDPISLRFEYPTTETLTQWAGELQAGVERRTQEATEAVRGLGGDPAAAAIAAAYQELIREQADIERRLQRYLTEAVRVRFAMEMLRQYAAQINAGGE